MSLLYDPRSREALQGLPGPFVTPIPGDEGDVSTNNGCEQGLSASVEGAAEFYTVWKSQDKGRVWVDFQEAEQL